MLKGNSDETDEDADIQTTLDNMQQTGTAGPKVIETHNGATTGYLGAQVKT